MSKTVYSVYESLVHAVQGTIESIFWDLELCSGGFGHPEWVDDVSKAMWDGLDSLGDALESDRDGDAAVHAACIRANALTLLKGFDESQVVEARVLIEGSNAGQLVLQLLTPAGAHLSRCPGSSEEVHRYQVSRASHMCDFHMCNCGRPTPIWVWVGNEEHPVYRDGMCNECTNACEFEDEPIREEEE